LIGAIPEPPAPLVKGGKIGKSPYEGDLGGSLLPDKMEKSVLIIQKLLKINS
jgi:hypothetical protein